MTPEAARLVLLDRLEAELALGWPEPWWPQDILAANPSWSHFLSRYIDVLGDRVLAAKQRAA